MTLRYASICSGIEAPGVAAQGLDLEPVFFAEKEPFPSAVLAQRFKGIPNLGDITTDTFMERAHALGPIDLLFGGTPCQSFSAAGKRGGMDDHRGRLALVLPRLAQSLRPRWVLWENVAGVLSSGRGRDFRAFVGALGDIGYGVAWRVLDARFFGLAQRRERVFLVGHLGDWRPAGAVLHEPQDVQGDRVPGGQTMEDAALPAPEGPDTGIPRTAGCLQERDSKGPDSSTKPGHLIPVAFDLAQITHPANGSRVVPGDPSPSLAAQGNPCVAVGVDLYNGVPTGSIHAPLRTAGGHGAPAVLQGYRVRVLTPRERERLMGFPDDFTAVRWRGKPATQCPDTLRYKALGNSIAVPVLRWVLSRLMRVEAITRRPS